MLSTYIHTDTQKHTIHKHIHIHICIYTYTTHIHTQTYHIHQLYKYIHTTHTHTCMYTHIHVPRRYKHTTHTQEEVQAKPGDFLALWPRGMQSQHHVQFCCQDHLSGGWSRGRIAYLSVDRHLTPLECQLSLQSKFGESICCSFASSHAIWRDKNLKLLHGPSGKRPSLPDETLMCGLLRIHTGFKVH